MSEIKTPREIMIKHWMRRMKEVYHIEDLEEDDFKQQEKEFQFMIEAMEEYKNQFPSPQEVTDNEIFMYATDKYPLGAGADEREIYIQGMKDMRSKLTNK